MKKSTSEAKNKIRIILIPVVMLLLGALVFGLIFGLKKNDDNPKPGEQNTVQCGQCEKCKQSEQGSQDDNKSEETDSNVSSIIEYATAGYHNSIYRGKDISEYLSDGSLWTRISSGEFTDLYVGDYFFVTLNGTTHTMRLAGFDVYRGSGNDNDSQHHAIIIPDEHCGKTSAVGASEGYYGSSAYQTIIPALVEELKTALGSSHVLKNNEWITISQDSTTKATNDCMWDYLEGISLSETEVYGYPLYACSPYESNRSACGQLPLFRLNPESIMCKGASKDDPNYVWYQLRTVTVQPLFFGETGNDVSYFVNIRGTGEVAWGGSDSYIRPRFIIG